MVIPLIMAALIDVGVATGDKRYILIKGAQMLICAVIALVLGMLYARYAATAGQGFGAELRNAEYKKVQSFSFKNTDHFSTSSLVTRLTSDVNILQNSITAGIRPLVRAPIMLITTLFLSFIMSWRLSLVFLVATPILGICLFLIVRNVRPMYGTLQKAIDGVNLVIQENLTAIHLVKSYARGDHEKVKFSKANEQLQSTSERAFHIATLNMPCFQLIMYATILAILWFGGNLVFIGDMKVGQLTGFLSYVLQILNSLMMLSSVFLMLTRSLASASRIEEVFAEVPDIIDPDDSRLSIQQGNVEFQNVYFKYNTAAKEYVLSDINLSIKAGQTIGILGGTGAAKSSLVQLIPRLYDITGGKLLIDGVDVKDYSIEMLRDQIGMVLQKNTLFSGTIKENLLWGNEHADEEELNWACHVSCADEFLNHMPNKLETDLGQGGVNISGGQKQRLCIARAVLKRPKVLIFDDSTSAVDSATEAKIRSRLAKDLKGTTQIIIAQRVTSIMHADQIVILENGCINAIGNHESLLAKSDMYREIYRSQQEGANL